MLLIIAQLITLVWLLGGLYLVVWTVRVVTATYPIDAATRRSEFRLLTGSLLTTVSACGVSAWQRSPGQGLYAIAVVIALCVGLFTVVAGILVFLRCRKAYPLIMSLIATFPTAWIIYFVVTT